MIVMAGALILRDMENCSQDSKNKLYKIIL